ncbi:MAG: DUF5670 family protein [Spirochaetia bacterium]|nr:DUF5670 family protein [Spirochaetia bacterium]
MTILLVVAIVLLVFWLLGLTTRITDSGLIHIALVIGVILLVVWFLRAGLRLI